MTAPRTRPSRPRTGTRARALDIALELFSEHGYEKTSLREIADRLGVTKAALYYHFRTKEDIVVGLVEEVSAPVDEAIAWARTQPYSPELREELLRRFAAGMAGRGRALLRFFHENRSVVRELNLAPEFKHRMLELTTLLHGPEASFEDRLRASMALMAVNAAHLLSEELAGADAGAARDRASLSVALEIAGRIGAPPQVP